VRPDRSLSLAPRYPFVVSPVALVALLFVSASGEVEWTPDVPLTVDASSSRTDIDGGLNVVVSDEIVMIVWEDGRDGNPEVYFKERIAGTWSSDLRLTNDPASSTHPAIVLWTDGRDGNEEIDFAEGSIVLDATAAPEITPVVGELAIGRARPNPFRSSTTFAVHLSKESELSVRVVDAAGRLVRELLSGRRPSGTHLVAWDGESRLGSRAAAGVYFIVAESGSGVAAQRVIRLR
jgi:hypothetical protein